MGFLSCLEPQHHLALPHSPPDLVSLGCSSSASSYPLQLSHKGLSWPHPAPPISPPMSSHDHLPPPPPAGPASTATDSPAQLAAAAAAAVTATTNASAAAPPPRQQLPSLSSLFGPPESVQSLRPSPLERPQPPPSIGTPAGTPSLPRSPPGLSLDRQPSPRSSYFPSQSTSPQVPAAAPYRTSPQASTYQLSPRSGYVAVGKWSMRQEDGPAAAYSQQQQQQQQRHSSQPPPPSAAYHHQPPPPPPSHPDTHRYPPLPPPPPSAAANDYHHHHPQSSYHSQPPAPSALAQQSPRSPYGRSSLSSSRGGSLGSCSGMSVAAVSTPATVSASVATSAPASTPAQTPVQTQAPAPAPAPASTTSTPAAAYSEGVPVKDGLGPKIWTGTHFLPRFVRAAEVPGEGMCYFYDDGSHCKTVIDGEAVNAHWGVTKAGKPRKRLAIACVTCREKKIKCDPDYPRCVQCEKLGRVCKFKNAPRGGSNISPGMPASEPDPMRRMSNSLQVSTPSAETPRSFGYPGSLGAPGFMGSPRTAGVVRAASPDSLSTVSSSSKRMRTSYDNYTPVGTRSPPLSISGRSLPPPPPPLSMTSSRTSPTEITRNASLLPPLAWGNSQPQPQAQQPQQPQPQPQYRAPYPTHSRSQSTSPSQQELPRILLPPPRDLSRKHDDILMRPWQQDLRPHGHA